jgi:methanogenic corrinoid protein MtbC1
MIEQERPDSAVGRYVDAIVLGDPRDAHAIVTELFASGIDSRTICLDVLAPALRAVGDLWQVGQVTVAQEHLATAITQAQLAWLAPRMTTSAAPGRHGTGREVILAGTPGELHAVGLRIVGDFLASDGWDVVELGAATPADDLVALVAERRPAAVGLSTALTTHLLEVRAIVARLHALPDPPVVIVGGAAYGDDEDLARTVGADRFAGDAAAASAVLRDLLG